MSELTTLPIPLDYGDPRWHSSCDWGHCDGAATWERYDPKLDTTLAVCGRCAHKRYMDDGPTIEVPRSFVESVAYSGSFEYERLQKLWEQAEELLR